MPKAPSPSKLSRVALERAGWPLVRVVEHWNNFAGIRQDLFGFVDIVALGPAGTLAVQTTTKHNLSARVAKILEAPTLQHVRAAGWMIEVHGWEYDHRTGEWLCATVDLTRPEE